MVEYNWGIGETVRNVESLPWTLDRVPQHGFTQNMNCLAYAHRQSANIREVGEKKKSYNGTFSY